MSSLKPFSFLTSFAIFSIDSSGVVEGDVSLGGIETSVKLIFGHQHGCAQFLKDPFAKRAQETLSFPIALIHRRTQDDALGVNFDNRAPPQTFDNLEQTNLHFHSGKVPSSFQ